MAESMVARRYAEALYQEAESAGNVERVDEDMVAISDAIKASRELQLFFSSPVISQAKKKSAAAALFAERVDPLVMRLIDLMIEKGRETLLMNTVSAYAALRDKTMGVVEAHVRTALPLGPEELDGLKTALERNTGQSVRLRIDVDPEMIAGLVVRVGDTVYDATARHQLKTLREQFAMRTYMSN